MKRFMLSTALPGSLFPSLLQTPYRPSLGRTRVGAQRSCQTSDLDGKPFQHGLAVAFAPTARIFAIWLAL